MITINSLVLFTVHTLVFTVDDYYAFISTFYCTSLVFTVHYNENTVQVLFNSLTPIRVQAGTENSKVCRPSSVVCTY